MATILLASEDAGASETLASEIAGEGHDVLEASDGQAVLDTVQAVDIDLVILDRQLAVFDGATTARKLREDPDVPAALPIVLLADLPLDARVLEAARATAQLPKKHDLHQVREMLAALLDPTPKG